MLAQNTNAARKGRAHFYHHFDNDTRHKKNARKFVKKSADDSHFGNSFREQSVWSGRPRPLLLILVLISKFVSAHIEPSPTKPRSGERMQPTAQAVGKQVNLTISPGGAKEKVADGRTCHDPNVVRKIVVSAASFRPSQTARRAGHPQCDDLGGFRGRATRQSKSLPCGECRRDPYLISTVDPA